MPAPGSNGVSDLRVIPPSRLQRPAAIVRYTGPLVGRQLLEGKVPDGSRVVIQLKEVGGQTELAFEVEQVTDLEVELV